MKVFYLILGVFLTFMVIMFLRVTETNKEISEVVKNTEKIQVVFYNGDDPDSYVELNSRNSIQDCADIISNKDTPFMKCRYDGKIIFFLHPNVAPGAKNTISIEFSLEPGCRHAAYVYGDALQTKELTDGGISLLQEMLKTSYTSKQTSD